MTPIGPAQLRPLVNGKVVVVTGASRGIGAELTRRFVGVGATVVGLAAVPGVVETNTLGWSHAL